MSNRFLITMIRQVGGGHRELYARTQEAASRAQIDIACDPAMIDAIRPAEYVDVDRRGNRISYVLDGGDK